MPSVSVVIPTYNRAALLEETIHSVLDQSVPVRELIVVDDGSTDDTLARLRRYGSRVTVIEQDRQWTAAAFNRGVDRATGDWIAFLGSDDLWDKTKVERQLQFIAAHPECDLVHTGYYRFGDVHGEVPPPAHFVCDDYRVEYLLFGVDWICPSSILLRRDHQVPFREWARVSEDIIHLCDLLRVGARFGFVNEPLVGYRVHHASLNHEFGAQSEGASMQWRWVNEVFDPPERQRLQAVMRERAQDRMTVAKREGDWPSYYGWRDWISRTWSDDLEGLGAAGAGAPRRDLAVEAVWNGRRACMRGARWARSRARAVLSR